MTNIRQEPWKNSLKLPRRLRWAEPSTVSANRRFGTLLLLAAGAAALVLGRGGRARAAAPQASVSALVTRADSELAAHPGQALLDYERARLLAPRVPEVAAGLARARAAAGLPPAAPGPIARAVQWLSPDEWSRLALAALALAALSATAAAWRWRRRWTLPAAAGALGLALASGGLAWRTAPRPADAVVVAANAVARIAPFAQAEAAFVVPEGSRVTIQSAHQGFARIDGSRGVGWVPDSAVERIIPGR